jgi:adhesin transport system outer membrane protein
MHIRDRRSLVSSGVPFKASQAAGILAATLIFAAPVAAQSPPPEEAGMEDPMPDQVESRVPDTTLQPEPAQAEAQAVAAVEDEAAPSSAKPAAYGPPVPRELSTESSGAPILRWSSAPFFIPPALEEAITIVTVRDPSSQAAWWRVRAADAGTRSARWQRFPSLSSNANLSTNDNFLLPSLTVDVPIWAGGRIGAGIKRAKTQEAAAEAGWDEVVLDLATQVSDLYYDIVLNVRLVIIYEDSLKAHLRLVETMERRVAESVSADVDLQLALSRAAQIEQELLIIQTQRDTSLQALAELIRDPNYDLGRAPDFRKSDLVADWQGIQDEALAYSPTKRRLDEEAKAAEYEIKIARASLFPQITAQYDYNDITGSRVGLGVRVQTGNGLSRLSDIDNARARFQTANNSSLLFQRQFRQQLASDVTLLQAALARTDVSNDASRTAARVSESYLRQFIAGRRSWLDVMNTLREDLSAKSGLAQAEVTAMATSARLHLRSGRWRPERIAGE